MLTVISIQSLDRKFSYALGRRFVAVTSIDCISKFDIKFLRIFLAYAIHKDPSRFILNRFTAKSDRTTASFHIGIMLPLAFNQNLWSLLIVAPLLCVLYKVNKAKERKFSILTSPLDHLCICIFTCPACACPWLSRVTRLPLLYATLKLQRTAYADNLLKMYGPLVVIAPDQVHTSDQKAMKIIYDRTSIKTHFYEGRICVHSSSWYRAYILNQTFWLLH
jgi:hypothetical protein